ncbi:unnamed protein product, partial [Discosporangium mesarthrocarpum]
MNGKADISPQHIGGWLYGEPLSRPPGKCTAPAHGATMNKSTVVSAGAIPSAVPSSTPRKNAFSGIVNAGVASGGHGETSAGNGNSGNGGNGDTMAGGGPSVTASPSTGRKFPSHEKRNTVSSSSTGRPSPTKGPASLGGRTEGVSKARCHKCDEHEKPSMRWTFCQSCGKGFHNRCLGFYTHLYQKPPGNWRCPQCIEAADITAVAPSPGAGKGKVCGEAAVAPAAAPMPVTTMASPAGHTCTQCSQVIGRKRAVACVCCSTHFHASCVGVKGATEPERWKCRDCGQ